MAKKKSVKAVINERNTLVFVIKVGLLLYVAFVIMSLGFWLPTGDIGIFTGTLLGGGMSLLNFELMRRIGNKIIANPQKPKIAYFSLVWIKFLAYITACFFIVMFQLVNMIAFFVSLSVIVFAIIGATVYAVYQGFTDMVDEEWQQTEEKYIGWDDVDKRRKKVYKTGGKKSVFDDL